MSIDHRGIVALQRMSIEFRIHDFWDPLAIARLRRLFERSQWWSAAQLRAYQEQKLREAVVHAVQTVPYYRDLFARLGLKPIDIATIADLQKLPVLTKETVRKEPARLHSSRANQYRPVPAQTSGTSGEPVHVLLDRPANVLEFAYYWRHWSWVGYRLGDRFAELSSSWFARDEQRARQPWHWQPLLRRLLLNSLSLSPLAAQEIAGALRTFRPAYLKGAASTLHQLALFLEESRTPAVELCAVFSTGETLHLWQRRAIERAFCCKVLDGYGHMERTVAISECPLGGMHVHSDYGLLELADSTCSGAAAHQNQPRVFTARVIGTSLYHRAMPLLRYDTGDVVEYKKEELPCRCGRGLPRVRRVHGRREDIVTRPEGGVVTALFVVFDELPEVAAGRIEQDALDHLSVTVVRGSAWRSGSEQRLREALRRFVGEAMRVSVAYVSLGGFRERVHGKFRAVTSCIPPHAGAPSGSDPATVAVHRE